MGVSPAITGPINTHGVSQSLSTGLSGRSPLVHHLAWYTFRCHTTLVPLRNDESSAQIGYGLVAGSSTIASIDSDSSVVTDAAAVTGRPVKPLSSRSTNLSSPWLMP